MNCSAVGKHAIDDSFSQKEVRKWVSLCVLFCDGFHCNFHTYCRQLHNLIDLLRHFLKIIFFVNEHNVKFNKNKTLNSKDELAKHFLVPSLVALLFFYLNTVIVIIVFNTRVQYWESIQTSSDSVLTVDKVSQHLLDRAPFCYSGNHKAKVLLLINSYLTQLYK